MESCALIPSYRPDGRLIQTIAALKEAGFERIVVVDDGSGAEFAPLFSQAERDYSAVVLRHTVNMGKGRALKTGFCWILARYPSCCAVSVDGDGQHSAESAVTAAELAEANPDALILGCRRFARQKSMPIPNLIGNVATRAAFFLLTGIRFADTQCGLRAYTPGVMRLLCNVAGDRFEFESNTLLAVRKLHLPVIEFGLEVLYAPAGEYVSTYRRAADSARIARCLLDFALLPLLFGLISSVLLLCFTAAGAAAEATTAAGAAAETATAAGTAASGATAAAGAAGAAASPRAVKVSPNRSRPNSSPRPSPGRRPLRRTSPSPRLSSRPSPLPHPRGSSSRPRLLPLVTMTP